MLSTAVVALAFARMQGMSAKDIFQRSEPSIATIRVHGRDGNDYIGSGFVIKPHAVATCWHVVSEAQSAEIDFRNGKKWRASIQGAKPDLDIAILQFEGSEKPLPTRADQSSPGEKLFAIGAPDGLTGSICDGLMSQARLYGTRTVYQISNPVTFGNSGGPVLDEQGRVIGIVSFGLKGYAALNFAIPTSELLNITGSARNTDIPTYRDKDQGGYHTFINKSKASDVVLVTVKYHVVTGGHALDIVDDTKQTVDRVKDGVETRTLTTLNETLTENGRTQRTTPAGPKTVHLDRFFRTMDDEPADPTAKRMYRSNRYYPPESLGAVMKVGDTWSVDIDGDGHGVPPAKFTAKFVGFEDVEGVRCAHLKTLYQEKGGDHPINVAQDMFCVYGLEVVKLDLYATNVPWSNRYADIHQSLNVTYWKHGPKPFSNLDRARGN